MPVYNCFMSHEGGSMPVHMCQYAHYQVYHHVVLHGLELHGGWGSPPNGNLGV